MIIDAKICPDHHMSQYDICVVGSGPAALSFISQFLEADNNIRIAILESGSTVDAIYQNSNELGGLSRLYRNINTDVQNLYEGSVNGWLKKKKENYFIESRLRGYGGTGNIWSGWFWTLEPNDLARGNWPIEYDELAEYYGKSCNLYGLPDLINLDSDRSDLKLPYMYVDENIKGKFLKPRHLLFKRLNFGQIYKELLAGSKSVDLILNANVTNLEIDKNNQAVSSLTVCVPISETAHKYLNIYADQFIIAAGCIETTRLLQLSEISKSSNFLGSFFQEHFYLWNAGTYQAKNIPSNLKDSYFSSKYWKQIHDVQIYTALVSTDEFLEKKNCNSFRVLLGGAPDIPNSINLCWEQEANNLSKILLDNEGPKDRFGNSRAAIDSAMFEKDQRTLRESILSTVDYLKEQNLGYDFELPDFLKDPLEWGELHRITPGNHPCGTTRMSMNASNGVVDANCQVHNFGNLFICSSSVFPTGGYANPTLTIIALSLRLSNYIKNVVRK